MKIIVSTKTFPLYIDGAIKNNITHFTINEKDKEIVFFNNINIKSYDILPVIGYEILCFKAKFNIIQMSKLSSFLKQLPEQPIVLEFHNYDENEIRITLSQFKYYL